MISLLVFLLILSILILVHEFGHFIVAKRAGVKVEEFSLGFGPQLFKKKVNDTQYCISAIPLGGYVKLAGDSLEEYHQKDYEYFSKPVGKRFQIIFAGPLLNYILGFLCFWLVFFVGYPSLTSKVGGLMDGFGAKEAGLEIGDKIIAVGSVKVSSWEELQNIIQANKNAPKVALTILRDNKEKTVEVLIKQKQILDVLGQKRSIGLLGITPYDEVITVRHGPWKSFMLGADKTWELTLLTYKGLWRMLTGKLSVRESVTGPLGIFYITSKAAKMGIIAVLHLVSVLSISLALFNVLPLPVLDGGHILFLAIEKIRGKVVDPKTERVVTKAGFFLIISLAIFVTYNDIIRFFGDKIANLFK